MFHSDWKTSNSSSNNTNDELLLLPRRLRQLSKRTKRNRSPRSCSLLNFGSLITRTRATLYAHTRARARTSTTVMVVKLFYKFPHFYASSVESINDRNIKFTQTIYLEFFSSCHFSHGSLIKSSSSS